MSSLPSLTSLETQYLGLLDELFAQPVYGLEQSLKEQLLLQLLNNLHQQHMLKCQQYQNIMKSNGQVNLTNSLVNLPYIAVRLFKHLSLSSIEQDEVYKLLQSSGTTSSATAKIFLDKATSARQSKALVKILQESIGKQRLPMLIIDSPSVVKDKTKFSARGAGIQGLAFFGRDHTYALDDNMQINWQVIDDFAQKYQGQKVLMFGFTFMVWLYFIQALRNTGKKLNFADGVLLHSGGWKKLEQQKVTNQHFNQEVKKLTGLSQVTNFYGMAEQVGSVFVECDQGHLHAPMLADVIVRNPYTLKECETGEQGLLQVLSALPTSYPGHSILTEDLGVLLGIDSCPCGQKGKYFKVDGRLPKTEVRGCSDTHEGNAVEGSAGL